MKFQAVAQPSDEQIHAVAQLAPTNPFASAAYVRAQTKVLDARPYALVLRTGTTLAAGGFAFCRQGRLTRTLIIESLPDLASGEDIYWAGLRQFCRTHKITALSVNSFASEACRIPAIQTRINRKQRLEHVLDLQAGDLKLSSQHRRNLKRAHKADLAICSTTSQEALRAHVALMENSMQRRRERGEAVPAIEAEKWRRQSPYLLTGAGEIFQALRAGEVVASVLILLARRGAYYQSAGVSPAGRDCGASTFLVHAISERLRERGFERFNLGGATPDCGGLYRFKSGFGARPVSLEAARCHLGNPWARKLRTLARDLRDDPRHIHTSVVRTERFAAYVAQPRAIASADLDPDIACIKLTDQALLTLPAAFSEHAERFRRLQFNDAYALTHRGRIVHVAWLIPARHDRRNKIRNVALRPGEAEITHCLTDPAQRGRGLYPLAIRCLCRIAADQGIHAVYMITNVNNRDSRRGIEKAGFTRCGTILRLRYPVLPQLSGPVIRTHRWPRPLATFGAGAT